MNIHLFGAATPTGEAFRLSIESSDKEMPLFAYSRKDKSVLNADFANPLAFRPGGNPTDPALWISFGPIWLLAPFLEFLATVCPDRLSGLRGLIACSSSSAVTKRFASNSYDRELVSRLVTAENQIIDICRRIDISCRILRPTLIYGSVGSYQDKNLSSLIRLMRMTPFLLMPKGTGLRQPIHANQLAAVTLRLALQLSSISGVENREETIALGGDSELSYYEMLIALQQCLPSRDPARRCRILLIPKRLFHFLAAPLMLISPKTFEAVLRISADLSGFSPAHQILRSRPQSFPLLPLL